MLDSTELIRQFYLFIIRNRGMSDEGRVEKLKEAYASGVIDINEFESEVTEELRKNARYSDYLNTSNQLEEQVWMSESEDENPDPAEFNPVNGDMHLPIKPKGGMWTSTYTPNEEHDSDWIRWCSSEGFYGGRHKWRLKPKEDIRVLVVDSLDDLKAITNVYKKEYYKGTKASLIGSFPLDFQLIAEDFDAMRLTEDGQWDTRLTGSDEPDLYGWDTESVLNFRWNWESYEYGGYCDTETRY
jgi:hypothetical protein